MEPGSPGCAPRRRGFFFFKDQGIKADARARAKATLTASKGHGLRGYE